MELASDDRLYLSSIGLITRIEQWAALLSAFCLLIGVRAAVLSESDRLVSNLSLWFVGHRRLMVVTDGAHALVVVSADRAHSVERDYPAGLCLFGAAADHDGGHHAGVPGDYTPLLSPVVALQVITHVQVNSETTGCQIDNILPTTLGLPRRVGVTSTEKMPAVTDKIGIQ